MKVIKLVSLLIIFALFSCSKDDDGKTGMDYPRTVNLKFEATASKAILGEVDITINNDTDYSGYVPFNKTVAQIEVERGTYLKIEYFDAASNNTLPYEIELKIYENNSVIAEKKLEITGKWQGGYLEYTYE